jgi:hypothetical protein
MLTPAEFVYEGLWYYKGYGDVKSLCYLDLYQPASPRPAVALFTEATSNPGTSITNRIEVLATMVWEYLQKPEKSPLIVEHYPDRGWHNPHTGRWQFPEHFDIMEMDRKSDGSFHKPHWRRVSRRTVEEFIGQRFHRK